MITRYANNLSNAQLEKVAGWTHGTDMHMRYEHLSDIDVSQAVAKANGLNVQAIKEEVKPQIKFCGRCKYSNAKDALYCGRCGSALDIGTALQEERDNQSLDQEMASYLSDPKHFEEYARRVLMEDYRRRERDEF